MDRQQDKDSAKGSTEDKFEIKTCTRRDCQRCEKLRVASVGHDFEVLHTPEMCLEASAKDDFLHVKVKDGTETKTKAGPSTAKSDTDTMKKAELNSKKDTSPSSSESEGFELLDNEDV